MDARRESEPNPMKNRTTVERKSEREIVVTRTFDAPPRIVFQAWTTPELFQRWWAPKSIGASLLSVEMDVRAGGGYRVVFGPTPRTRWRSSASILEVTPHSRLLLDQRRKRGRGRHHRDLRGERRQDASGPERAHPSKEALEANEGGMLPEQFEQLDELLVTLKAGV